MENESKIEEFKMSGNSLQKEANYLKLADGIKQSTGKIEPFKSFKEFDNIIFEMSMEADSVSKQTSFNTELIDSVAALS